MIADLILTFGPALLSLAFLIFLAIRFRGIVGGEISSEHGQRFSRTAQPSWYWLYVGVYFVGAILSIVGLVWGALWIGYLGTHGQ